VKINVLGQGRNIADDLQAEQRTGKTTAVAEETNALGCAGVKLDVGQETDQASVDTGGVHVTALSGNLNTRVHSLVVALLGQGHEGLLDSLVGDRLGVLDIANLGGDFGKRRVGWVSEVVVVEHARVGLGNELAVRGMEENVIKAIEWGLFLGDHAVGAVALLQGLLASVVGLVAGVYSLGVALDGEVAIDVRVLAGKVGLVEVVGVGDVAAAQTGLKHEGSVGADDHGDTSSATGGTGSSLGVQSDVASNHDGITAIPGRRLDPIDAVENSIGASVAGIDGIDALDVVVTRLLEQLHQDGLDGFGLVEQGLGSDFQAADCLGVDFIFAKEGGEGSEGEGVDVFTHVSLRFLVCLLQSDLFTFTVIAEAHLSLAETNGVFPLADAIEFLQLNLVNALHKVRRNHSTSSQKKKRTWLGK
jgi:hypothetical protein